MPRVTFSTLPLIFLLVRPLAGQAASSAASPEPSPDTATFTVLRAADTVAIEVFTRGPGELAGTLVLPPKGNQRTRYRAALLPDATAPLVELSTWRGTDPAARPARQTTRVIFRDDSVAVDDMTSTGMVTLVLPTQVGAIPYLNLSFALLEQATMRAWVIGGDSVAVPFFSLGGGQTASGSVMRLGADSALVEIGAVVFRLKVDDRGEILGGTIPTQGVEVVRSP